jgi:hypothetical protein
MLELKKSGGGRSQNGLQVRAAMDGTSIRPSRYQVTNKRPIRQTTSEPDLVDHKSVATNNKLTSSTMPRSSHQTADVEG